MTQGSCKNCTERKIGCHATCEKYAEFANQCKAIREAKRKQFLLAEDTYVRLTKRKHRHAGVEQQKRKFK